MQSIRRYLRRAGRVGVSRGGRIGRKGYPIRVGRSRRSNPKSLVLQEAYPIIRYLVMRVIHVMDSVTAELAVWLPALGNECLIYSTSLMVKECHLDLIAEPSVSRIRRIRGAQVRDYQESAADIQKADIAASKQCHDKKRQDVLLHLGFPHFDPLPCLPERRPLRPCGDMSLRAEIGVIVLLLSMLGLGQI